MAFNNNQILIEVGIDISSARSSANELNNVLRNIGNTNGNGFGSAIEKQFNFDRLKSDLKSFTGFVSNINQHIGELIKNAGGMTVNAIKDSVNEYMELSKSTAELRGVLLANGSTQTEVDAEVQRLDNYNSQRIMNGSMTNRETLVQFETEWSKTGLKTDTNTLERALRFTEANDLQSDEVAKLSKMFLAGRQGDEYTNLIPWFYDAIQRSADLSPADVQDYVSALKYSHPSAVQGVEGVQNFKEATATELAFETMMSNMGLDASSGGTMFRRVFTKALTEDFSADALTKKKTEAMTSENMTLENGNTLFDVYKDFGQLLYTGSNFEDALTAFRQGKALDNYNNGEQISNEQLVKAFGALDDIGLNDEQMNNLSYLMAGLQGLQGFAGLQNTEQFTQLYKDILGSNGSVDSKYGEVSESLSAKRDMFSNLWELAMENTGMSLSPLTESIYDYAGEIIKTIFNMDGNIDSNVLRKAIDKVGDNLTEQFGDSAIGEGFKRIGNTVVDWIDGIVEIAPQLFENFTKQFGRVIEDLENGDYGQVFADLFGFLDIFDNIDTSGINSENVQSGINAIGHLLDFLQLLEGLNIGAKGGIGIIGLMGFFNILSSFARLVSSMGRIGTATQAGEQLLGNATTGFFAGLAEKVTLLGSAGLVTVGITTLGTAIALLFSKLCDAIVNADINGDGVTLRSFANPNNTEFTGTDVQNNKGKKGKEKVDESFENTYGLIKSGKLSLGDINNPEARTRAGKRLAGEEKFLGQSPEIRLTADALQGMTPKTPPQAPPQQAPQVNVPQNVTTNVHDTINTNTTVQDAIHTNTNTAVTVPFSVNCSVPVSVTNTSKTIYRTISGTKSFGKSLNNSTSKSSSTNSRGNNAGRYNFGQYR